MIMLGSRSPSHPSRAARPGTPVSGYCPDCVETEEVTA
jgi:hypothetical protein